MNVCKAFNGDTIGDKQDKQCEITSGAYKGEIINHDGVLQTGTLKGEKMGLCRMNDGLIALPAIGSDAVIFKKPSQMNAIRKFLNMTPYMFRLNSETLIKGAVCIRAAQPTIREAAISKFERSWPLSWTHWVPLIGADYNCPKGAKQEQCEGIYTHLKNARPPDQHGLGAALFLAAVFVLPNAPHSLQQWLDAYRYAKWRIKNRGQNGPKDPPAAAGGAAAGSAEGASGVMEATIDAGGVKVTVKGTPEEIADMAKKLRPDADNAEEAAENAGEAAKAATMTIIDSDGVTVGVIASDASQAPAGALPAYLPNGLTIYLNPHPQYSHLAHTQYSSLNEFKTMAGLNFRQQTGSHDAVVSTGGQEIYVEFPGSGMAGANGDPVVITDENGVTVVEGIPQRGNPQGFGGVSNAVTVSSVLNGARNMLSSRSSQVDLAGSWTLSTQQFTMISTSINGMTQFVVVPVSAVRMTSGTGFAGAFRVNFFAFRAATAPVK